MFEDALVFTMQYEVGPWFKLDADTIAGLCKTPAQKKKVGYVNDPKDRGGETKFGIASKANPDVNIKDLTWEQAKAIYEKKYWLAAKCDKFPEKVAYALFDASVHHGPTTAVVLLQRALGLYADGLVGPRTLEAACKADPVVLVTKMLNERRKRFDGIVKNFPEQRKFYDGWMNRCDKIYELLCKA